MSDLTTNQPSRRAFLAQSAAALAAAHSAFAAPAPPSTPHPLPLGTVHVAGDLGRRTDQNFARLQSDMYRPPLVFNGVNVKAWPGDIEGRALLAVTLLARSTGHEPDYFESMVAEYPRHMNEAGYFGQIQDVRAINEQQLSGHGWLLRGLCEFYEYKRRPETLAQIRTIVTNLALPLRGHYRTYPLEPSLRSRTGDVNGTLTARQGEWVLSSDIGCAFIFLDGLTHAWTLLHDPALKALIDEAIARFLQIDLVAFGAQTHATLTCLRALLRMHAETADPALLLAVAVRYKLYRETAMTEHYANYNWFGRPDSWTEPCAIIDSYMIANALWERTGEAAYLEEAHLIWFNGLGRGMRGNGGFGTDLCAGYKTPFLKVRSYEAYFCCTMRAGEGHARAAQALYSTRADVLSVPHFSTSEAEVALRGGTLKLRQTTNYPYSGPVRLEVLASTVRGPVTLRLFAPRWSAARRVTLNGKAVRTLESNGFSALRLTPKPGDIVVLEHTLLVTARLTRNPKSLQGYYAFEAGPLMLGHAAEEEIFLPQDARLEETATGQYRVAGGALTLARINDLNELAAGPKDPCTRQVLFRSA